MEYTRAIYWLTYLTSLLQKSQMALYLTKLNLHKNFVNPKSVKRKYSIFMNHEGQISTKS